MRLVEQQSPDEAYIPSVADAVSDQLADRVSSEIVPSVEIPSPGSDIAPPVADSIVNQDSTNPVTVVQPSSLVDVGAVEIVTVDVHAAWDAAESPLPDPVGDTEVLRSSPGVGDIQQSTHDRTRDPERVDNTERNPTAATHVQQEGVRQVETPSADVNHVDLDSIRTAQAEDDSIKVVVDHLGAGADPGDIDIRQYPEDARQLFGQWESLVVRDGVLYRRFYHPDGTTKFLQVVLPPVLCRPFVEKLHAELGHFGRSKTALAVSRRAYFPAWHSFTHLVVKNCSVCNRLQRSKQPQKQTKLRPMTTFRPMAVLHVDLVGPILPGRNSQGQRGFQYILSVVDSAMRYLWLLPLCHKTADEVAAVLCEQVILRISCPSAIITDQGKEFTGAVVQAVCDKLGITRLRTFGYHPQTDSKAEHVHFSVHNMITKLLDKVNPSLWVDALGPGVRQGCVLAPALFLVAIDWILPGLLISKYRASSILYRRYFLSIDGVIAATSENSYQ